LQHGELFERNEEVHKIVDFLFNEEQKLLFVKDRHRIGSDSTIKEAILFSIARMPNISGDHIFKVDLERVYYKKLHD
jgi:hypothetical protein